MTYTYGPGTGHLVAFGDVLVLLPDGASPETLRQLWDVRLLHAEGSFLDVLSAITTSFDPLIEHLPRFALVHLGAATSTSREVRVAVCGSLSVVIGHARQAEPTVVRGEGAAMWLEERVTDARFFAVSDSAGSESAAHDPFMELRDGVTDQPSDDLSCEARRVDTTLVLTQGVVLAQGACWTFADADAGLVETSIVATRAETGEFDLVDDDFGRTLAQLPESWSEDESDSVADELFAGSLSPRTASAEPALFPSSDNYIATQVMSGLPENVAPTEVVAPPVGQQYFGDVPGGGAYSVSHGFVRFSHGEKVELGSTIVVGRKPSHDGSGAEPQARMISVPSPSKDISRNHVMIRVEQGHVTALDLDSVNGTVLKRAGQQDRDLVPFQTTLILSDDVLDLGDGVSLSFEQIR